MQTTLIIPHLQNLNLQFQTELNRQKIENFLAARGIDYQRWTLEQSLPPYCTDEEILAFYEPHWKPYAEKKGYQAVDVINILPDNPQLPQIREKFYREHTHTEDEVRFFVDGEGLFWFHVNEEVFALRCTAGDLLSVPAGYTHWFELSPSPRIKVIRLFTDALGWQAQYTELDKAQDYRQRFTWSLSNEK
jgi:1,2-dihydroxy-3-keto-5-methylthiopentene dioxygenase